MRPRSGVMVATPSVRRELAARGFANLGRGRAASTRRCSIRRGATSAIDLSAADLPFGRPHRAARRTCRPSSALDLPGSKVVVGDGPQLAELQRRFPGAHFLGPPREWRARAALCRRRRLRLPEPHRHLRPRAARSARLGPAGRGLSGAGPLDVIGDERRRRARRGSAARRRWRRSISRANAAASTRCPSAGAPAPRCSSISSARCGRAIFARRSSHSLLRGRFGSSSSARSDRGAANGGAVAGKDVTLGPRPRRRAVRCRARPVPPACPAWRRRGRRCR